MLLVTCVAVAVYRPDRPLPFDLWDFREFLPILESHRGMREGYEALLGYYAGHGRMNPLFYFTFVLQYALFGDHAWAWQITRFSVMLIDAGLLLWLARRLRLGWLGAVTTTLLFVVGTPAVRAWVQLMAEPLVIGLLLIAAHLALNYREAPHWRARATIILACIAAAFLTKEIAGALGAVVVLLALCGWGENVSLPDLRAPRNIVLAAGAAIVACLVAVLILEVRSLPEATGYGMAYGRGSISLGRFLEDLAATTLPVHPNGQTVLGLLYPANVLALLLVGLGYASWARSNDSRRLLVRSVVFAIGMAVFGTLLYLPWPKFDSFYALPFFLGPALLLGAAVDTMDRAGGSRRIAGGLAAAAMVFYAAIPAVRSSATATAALHLNVAVVRVLAGLDPSDTVFVLGPTAGPRALPVAAAELHGYGLAVRAWAMPVMLDRDCGMPPVNSPRVAVLTYSYGCGLLPQPTMRLNSSYRWRDWLTLAALSDTLTIDLSGPPISRDDAQRD